MLSDVAPDLAQHEVVWYGDRWECTCQSPYIVTDLDARLHYSNMENERDRARAWIEVTVPDGETRTWRR